ATFEPAVHRFGRVGGERGRACLVPLAVEHAEGAAGAVEILREERQRLRDPQPRAEEHGQQGAVADAGGRAPRAGGAERFHVGESEGLGRESAGGLSLHTFQTVLERFQCRFSKIPTLYAACWPPRAARSRETTLFGGAISGPMGSIPRHQE